MKRIIPQEDDILFSREAPIGNVGIVPKNFTCCQGQRVVLLRPITDIVYPRFLLHALQGGLVRSQIEKVESIGTTVSNFNIADLRKLIIKVPAMEIQIRISEKMDKIASYSVDMNNGLPAEIHARQKQFEYYRNVLLSFKERTA